MTLDGTNALNTHPPEFEPFLYAAVGEDRNGNIVTVLSALARLGLDLWSETADLVARGRDAGRARIALLLSRFRDIPALGGNHGSVAQKHYQAGQKAQSANKQYEFLKECDAAMSQLNV